MGDYMNFLQQQSLQQQQQQQQQLLQQQQTGLTPPAQLTPSTSTPQSSMMMTMAPQSAPQQPSWLTPPTPMTAPGDTLGAAEFNLQTSPPHPGATRPVLSMVPPNPNIFTQTSAAAAITAATGLESRVASLQSANQDLGCKLQSQLHTNFGQQQQIRSLELGMKQAQTHIETQDSALATATNTARHFETMYQKTLAEVQVALEAKFSESTTSSGTTATSPPVTFPTFVAEFLATLGDYTKSKHTDLSTEDAVGKLVELLALLGSLTNPCTLSHVIGLVQTVLADDAKCAWFATYFTNPNSNAAGDISKTPSPTHTEPTIIPAVIMEKYFASNESNKFVLEFGQMLPPPFAGAAARQATKMTKTPIGPDGRPGKPIVFQQLIFATPLQCTKSIATGGATLTDLIFKLTQNTTILARATRTEGSPFPTLTATTASGQEYELKKWQTNNPDMNLDPGIFDHPQVKHFIQFTNDIITQTLDLRPLFSKKAAQALQIQNPTNTSMQSGPSGPPYPPYPPGMNKGAHPTAPPVQFPAPKSPELPPPPSPLRSPTPELSSIFHTDHGPTDPRKALRFFENEDLGNELEHMHGSDEIISDIAALGKAVNICFPSLCTTSPKTSKRSKKGLIPLNSCRAALTTNAKIVNAIHNDGPATFKKLLAEIGIPDSVWTKPSDTKYHWPIAVLHVNDSISAADIESIIDCAKIIDPSAFTAFDFNG
jgi:hypothetical protein